MQREKADHEQNEREDGGKEGENEEKVEEETYPWH
jgi:hypothetical protein